MEKIKPMNALYTTLGLRFKEEIKRSKYPMYIRKLAIKDCDKLKGLKVEELAKKERKTAGK